MLFLLLQACGTSKKKSSDENNTKDSTSTAVKSNRDTIPQPAPPDTKLAPGQAKVAGKLTAANKENGVLRLQVNSVLGYGSATPTIGVGDTLSIKNGSSKDQKHTVGSTVTLRIQKNISRGDDSQIPGWSLVKFEK